MEESKKLEAISHLLFSMAPQAHWIAFGLLLLAGFNLPISEDLVFIISASIAATIIPENVIPIFLGCFFGAYFSDLIAYLLGRYALNKILTINFFRRQIPPSKIEKMTSFFDKYGNKTLLLGRFIPFGVRNFIFITSGLIKMKLTKFLLLDFIALIFTSTILFSLGYIFGNNYQKIFPYLDKYKIIITLFLVLLILFFYFKKKIVDKKNSY